MSSKLHHKSIFWIVSLLYVGSFFLPSLMREETDAIYYGHNSAILVLSLVTEVSDIWGFLLAIFLNLANICALIGILSYFFYPRIWQILIAIIGVSSSLYWMYELPIADLNIGYWAWVATQIALYYLLIQKAQHKKEQNH